MSQIKMTLYFTAEILSFMITGMYFVIGNYFGIIVFFVFAMTFAFHTGKLIEKEAIRKYKKNE